MAFSCHFLSCMEKSGLDIQQNRKVWNKIAVSKLWFFLICEKYTFKISHRFLAFVLHDLVSNIMPVLAVCSEWNWILKEYHFASNTNWGQREFFASERHFVLLQRALLSFSLFLSLRERRWGGDFPSMHYSSSVTDTNWAAATAEGLPVNVCVPASNQNRACWHTHIHTHTHKHTQQHGDKQENPCPSSLSTILNQRIDPWRTHREFVEILTDTCRHTRQTWAQISTNRCILFT